MSYRVFKATPLAHARLAARVARNEKKMRADMAREKRRITDTDRLNFMGRKGEGFHFTVQMSKGVYRWDTPDEKFFKSVRAMIDAAIKAERAGKKRK